jgi:molecular chaperone Hsp33
VFEGQGVIEACRCSSDRIEDMLRRFTRDERRDMVGDNGRIGITCEFCSTHRDYDPADFDPA